MGNEGSPARFMSYQEALEKQRQEEGSSFAAELAEASRLARQHDVFQLLQMLVDRKGSDLQVKVGSPPGICVDGQIEPIDERTLAPEARP